MLIDTHAHLDQLTLSSYDDHHPIITVSTDLASCHSNFILAQKHPTKVMMACGLHPWFVQDSSLQELNLLLDYIESNNIQIMGEIGLDFSPSYKSTRNQQLEILEIQLRFASQHNLSVSLHLLKAYDELFDLLRTYPVKGAIHSFPGSLEQAKRFSKLGIKIGVNGLILRDNAPRYLNLVTHLPIENIVIESDAPNIPYPDGRPGDLNMITLIASRLSQIKQLELETLCQITTQNAIESFKLYELL
ncbi:TatD family hydrolase [Thiomicrospira sp.]|uniref:TatD family hydrolase n=1 Tax=Thiomicrospira sp. TaxID=935 RepID=UPI002F947A1E